MNPETEGFALCRDFPENVERFWPTLLNFQIRRTEYVRKQGCTNNECAESRHDGSTVSPDTLAPGDFHLVTTWALQAAIPLAQSPPNTFS